ncbi:MAG: o-succinylbenzoate synthase [Archangium sp.]|nr:o-succinylbenzoate synthase [Archangium sp.]
MKARLELHTLRFRTPLVTARGPMKERSGFVVQLEHEGVIGRGEARPWEAFGTESLVACQAALEAWQLVRVPETVEEIDAALASVVGTPSARFALECALLELLSLRKNRSIAQLLGVELPKSISVSALLDGDSSEALCLSAERAVADGFRTLKLKVAAHGLSTDAQRLAELRRVVGANVAIRIDANGGWSEGMARSALRGLESLNLELCEQPVAAGDVEALRRVRRLVPCRIAADEALLVPGGAEKVLANDPRPAAEVLVLKPMALGGLRPALALAHTAQQRGVSAYVTTLLDGPLARAAAVVLAQALHGTWAHGVATVEGFEGQQVDRFTPHAGSIRPWVEPGWGLS